MQNAKEIHPPFQPSHDWQAFQWPWSTDQVFLKELQVSNHDKSKYQKLI